MTILTFGKYKGEKIQEISIDYLKWGAKNLNSQEWKKEFQAEIDRREKTQKEEKNNRYNTIQKLGVDSAEAWEIFMKEAEQELQKEDFDEYDNQESCGYSGYFKTVKQEDVEELALFKKQQHLAKVQLIGLDEEFCKKWEVGQEVIDEIYRGYSVSFGELDPHCFSSRERWKAAKEFSKKRFDLINIIDGLKD